MNKIALGEMALNAYNSVGKLADVIENAINSKSLLTAGENFGGNIIAAFEAICRLLERKTTLINFKIQCDSAFNKLSMQHLKILTLKYIDRFSNCEICNCLKLSNRTYFRKLKSATEFFGRNLYNEGLNEKPCEKLFGNENWLKKIYYHFCKTKEPEFESENIFSLKTEIKELKCV